MASLFKAPERVLVFAAHPDDELIWLGGTICRLHGEDCAVRVVLFQEEAGGLRPAEKPMRREFRKS